MRLGHITHVDVERLIVRLRHLLEYPAVAVIEDLRVDACV